MNQEIKIGCTALQVRYILSFKTKEAFIKAGMAEHFQPHHADALKETERETVLGDIYEAAKAMMKVEGDQDEPKPVTRSHHKTPGKK